MARHGEGQLRLASAPSVEANDDHGARVENGGERGEPRLVVMLRAEVAEQRVREMALEHVRSPALPLAQQLRERGVVGIATVTPQQLRRGGWGAGAGIEQ